MRQDMAKVIVERPRFGGGVKYPRGSAWGTDRVPMEDWRHREGIGRPWHRQGWGVQKELNENLAPLRRFLRSSVGRPWDKVYGEICERINRNSAVQLHIWQHLVDYVCTNPYEVEGYVGHRRHGFPPREFHVDPKTGLLRESGRLRKWQRKRLPQWNAPGARNPVVPINDNRCYEQIDGVWFELDLRKPPANGKVFDPRYGANVEFKPRYGFREYRGRRLYIGARRQLDKKEANRVARQFRAAFYERSDP
jgi:hypothetical protein